MTLAPSTLAELRDIVGEEGFVGGGPALLGLSRDFFWLSPVLSRDLPATVADVVLMPRSTDEVAAILAIAYRDRLPLVARGRGTGNYGQAVPLSAGLVLETSRLAALIEVGHDSATVGAGMTFQQLESALAERGREVAVMPSMIASTVAGFLQGGNQGLGSIEYGAIWDGWVRSMTVVGCVQHPRPIRVSGVELARHLHAYGTTGVVTEVELETAPKRERTALFAAFDGLSAATRAGRALMDLPVPPRAISVDDEAVYRTFLTHSGLQGAVALRALLEVGTVDAARSIITDHAGTVTAVDASAIPKVINSIYNHSTLRAQRADPRLCSVQIRGAAIVDREAEVRAALPDARIHLDGNAPKRHGKGFSGLLFSSWVDDETLTLGMQRLRDLGVVVVNPHTWLVGSHGGVSEYVAAAKEHDPRGLLNPGKLVRPATAPTPTLAGAS